MDDILAKKNRHLFLEEKDNTHNSFISNINYAVENIDTIKTFNENVNSGTMQHLLETYIEHVGTEGNAWVVKLTELGESILATTSGFNYAAVLTVNQDIEAGATITLPEAMKYRVGTHMLLVSWNGTVCYNDEQYEEVGAFNEKSTVIKIKQDIKTGDKLEFRTVALADITAFANQIDSVLDNASIIATGSTKSRKLTDRFSDIINVKDFGAKGNGETDDTQSIQAALDAGIGNTVYFPAGVYLVSSTLIAHAGTKIIGAGKCDYWGSAYSTTGTVLKTNGVGNPSQWTDITGEDTNETPLLVCGGNGIYVDDLTLYTDENINTWSIGLFYPAVKQCGFHRIGVYGFSNAPIYLDCTWGSSVTALTSLHPSVVTGNGMNEFYGEDFFARAKKTTITNKDETEIGNTECFGIKIKGTTRDSDSYNRSTWLWSSGGASDIVFTKGRVTGILVDGAMNTGNGAIQGIRFENIDIRMRSGCGYGYGIYLNRCNRVSFRGGYSEVSDTPGGRGYANFSTTNTYLVSFEDIEYGFYVSLNDTATSYRLNRGVPSLYDGTLYKPSVRVTTKSGSVVSNEVKTPYPNFSIRTIDVAAENNEYTISRNDLIRFDVSNSSAKSVEIGNDITLLLNASVRPKETNIHNLGSSSYKWATMYADSVGKNNNRVENGYFNNISANSGSISDSDKNLKNSITNVDNNLLRAWGNIEIKLFRFNDAVEKKGEKARIHAGIIAQDVEKAFSLEGIDASRYGLFCYDSWDDVYEDELIVDKEESIDDETGITIPAKTHIEKRLVSKGGSRYGIRYEEALVLECAYLRNELKKQNAKIEALMQRISVLENNR